MNNSDLSAADRMTCPVCGRPDRALTKTGKVKQHDDPSKGRSWSGWGVPCAASGKHPDELEGGAA